jgi:hypothetical protein
LSTPDHTIEDTPSDGRSLWRQFRERWRVLVAAIVTVFALAFAGFAVARVLHTNTDDIQRIKGVLFSEKICSVSNTGEACRALFNRLADSLSEKQRFRLACDVLAALDLPEMDKLRQQAKCPPPITAP